MELLFASLACMSDINGQPIEYWYAIKYPKGFKYSFGFPGQSLMESEYDMQDTDRGTLTWTMEQLWNPNISYIIYNDESPLNKPYNPTYGHTKGILATDGTQGFWLQHSTPKWPLGPTYAASYEGLTSNGFDYGQHFFCLTLSHNEIEHLAGHLELNHPNIQDSQIGSEAGANMTALATGYYSTAPICDTITLRTASHDWTVFAKTSKWNNELYSECIQPLLDEPLYVESWIRGSACKPSETVHDIKEVEFNNISWSEYNDHSKWAVGSRSVCFSDINRMTTQASRGGGAICVADKQIYNDFINGKISSN
jgi:deoxyribonuclease-2